MLRIAHFSKLVMRAAQCLLMLNNSLKLTIGDTFYVEVCKWGIGHGYFGNGGPTICMPKRFIGTVHADVRIGSRLETVRGPPVDHTDLMPILSRSP